MISPHSPFYQSHCIRCRLPQSFCCCSQLQTSQWPFEILLLTHPSEWQKQHNTGQWLMLNQDGNIQRMRWARKMTPPTINPGDYLLFPSQDAQPVDAQMGSQIKRLWLIDGTWQQANKMLRQSSWLQQLPSLQLSEYDSQFSLRRNQQGLCTMESAIAACAAANCDFDSSAAQFNFQLLQNACLTISSS